MTSLPTAAEVTHLHHHLLNLAGWPMNAPTPPAGDSDGLWHWIQTNHRNNCLLWAEEDLARRTQVGAEAIAANKRAIDRFNQARNDATERVDEFLLLALGLVDLHTMGSDAPVSRAPSTARLNSETAGSIIDRMSILSLKVHAMRAQTLRDDVDSSHRDASQRKLERLEQQLADLGHCLDELLAETRAGKACFKVYRQFKMYNDPRFNPELVKEAAAALTPPSAPPPTAPA
ncbi:MAG: DUF4254 domain-containing protein [Rubrivivax sp.]|nr:DUF4254 domain-containing protein [Rubrivivax sp.]